MDVHAKHPGGRHNLDTCGQPGEGRSKSCGRLLWMTAKIKILFYKNKTSYIVLRNYYYNSNNKLLVNNKQSCVNDVYRKAELLQWSLKNSLRFLTLYIKDNSIQTASIASSSITISNSSSEVPKDDHH